MINKLALSGSKYCNFELVNKIRINWEENIKQLITNFNISNENDYKWNCMILWCGININEWRIQLIKYGISRCLIGYLDKVINSIRQMFQYQRYKNHGNWYSCFWQERKKNYQIKFAINVSKIIDFYGTS